MEHLQSLQLSEDVNSRKSCHPEYDQRVSHYRRKVPEYEQRVSHYIQWEVLLLGVQTEGKSLHTVFVKFLCYKISFLVVTWRAFWVLTLSKPCIVNISLCFLDYPYLCFTCGTFELHPALGRVCWPWHEVSWKFLRGKGCLQ